MWGGGWGVARESRVPLCESSADLEGMQGSSQSCCSTQTLTPSVLTHTHTHTHKLSLPQKEKQRRCTRGGEGAGGQRRRSERG